MQRLITQVKFAERPVLKTANVRHCWWRPFRKEPQNPMYLPIPNRTRAKKSRRTIKVVFKKDHVVKSRKTGNEYNVGWAGEVRHVSNKMYRNELMDFQIAVPASRLTIQKYHHIYSRDYLDWIHKQRVTEKVERKISSWSIEIQRRINEETDKFIKPITPTCVAEAVYIKYGIELDPLAIRFDNASNELLEELEIPVYITTTPGNPALSLNINCVADHSPDKPPWTNPPRRAKQLSENLAGGYQKIPTIIVEQDTEKLLL